METLDGNAIAGTLVAVFDTELTTASGVCAACGDQSLVGEFAVYLRAPGTVARCPRCTSVLIVIVEANRARCVDLRGLEVLDPPA
jgi:hypothetical protein